MRIGHAGLPDPFKSCRLNCRIKRIPFLQWSTGLQGNHSSRDSLQLRADASPRIQAPKSPYIGSLKCSRSLKPNKCYSISKQTPGQLTNAEEENWRSPLQKDGSSPPIVALGKFDALHVGHRSLAVKAAEMGGTPWLVSFSGMAEVLGWPSRAPIIADCQREDILKSWAPNLEGKVPHYRALPFAKVRSMQPEEFVSLLAKDLKAEGVVVGKGYKFGYKQSGDAETLRDLGTQMGMRIEILDLVGATYPGLEGHASSSEVRKALQEGNLKRVEHLLGRPYTITAFLPQKQLSSPLSIPKQAMENQVPMIGNYAASYMLTFSDGKQHKGQADVSIKEFSLELGNMDAVQATNNLTGDDKIRIDLTFQ